MKPLANQAAMKARWNMADNFLNQLRRQAATSGAQGKTPPVTPPPPSPPAREEYVAFAAKDKTLFLDIRLAKPPFQSPRNTLLVNVAHDGPSGTNFLVTYTTMSILVQGRNLQEIVYAIQNLQAAYIQEFDPDRWLKPENNKAPFIESIEVHFHGDTTGANKSEAARH
jgi:hypothetical protein